MIELLLTARSSLPHLRYVPEGHPTIFDITKRKIHNVLQGVAPEGIEMTDLDKKWFETWIDQNCARL